LGLGAVVRLFARGAAPRGGAALLAGDGARGQGPVADAGGGVARGEEQGSGLDGGQGVELAAQIADELHVALVVLLGRGDGLRGQIGVAGGREGVVGGDLRHDLAQRGGVPAAVLRVRKLPLKLALWAVMVTRSGGPDHVSSSTVNVPLLTRPRGTPVPRDQPSARDSVAP
jgi:hypothetical protein